MTNKPKIYLALVHYPILNQAGKEVTTSVTNLDVHDIARIAKTYDCEGYYIVTPIDAQRQMVNKLRNHWNHGPGPLLDHPRRVALNLVEPVKTLKDAADDIWKKENEYPTLVATSARPQRAVVSFDEARKLIRSTGPVLLVFGTGWGLAESAMGLCNIVLEQIEGVDGYNHLPVRAAVAIMLDRLLT